MRTPTTTIRVIESLHDVAVIGIALDYRKRLLSIEVDDLYANFRGWPNYPGSIRGVLSFTLYRDLEVSLEPLASEHELLWIYEAEASLVDTSITFAIRFSPAGRISGKAMTVSIDEPSMAWVTLLGLPPPPNDSGVKKP